MQCPRSKGRWGCRDCIVIPSHVLQGFRKSDPDQWQFSNERFIRGRKDLLRDIHRRKTTPGGGRDVANVAGNAAIEVHCTFREAWHRASTHMFQSAAELHSSGEHLVLWVPINPCAPLLYCDISVHPYPQSSSERS